MITEEEISRLSVNPPDMDDEFCRMLVHFMIGYLAYPGNEHDRINRIRQTFFHQIKKQANKQERQHEANVSGREAKAKAG